jgi:hypothetical protein
VHGFTVATAAVAMGDQGPRFDRRLRLSPLAHLDILRTAADVLLSVGWIKPIAVDVCELRHRSYRICRLWLWPGPPQPSSAPQMRPPCRRCCPIRLQQRRLR